MTSIEEEPMPVVNPYLLFNGNCEEAFVFYQSVLGGELVLIRFGDMPGDPGDMPADVAKRIAHAAMPFSETNLLMASDCPPDREVNTVNQGFHVQLELDSAAEADRVFHALTSGGEIDMAFGPVPWAEAYGLGTDKFGVSWMVNYTGNVTMRSS
ncbi:VOC family protein [Nocardia sp. NPDC020380]|uniref:VOC family protein n=1 Tax=Nocardia sp. NPDC020380 TaxID=3364309 RepID=UPI0037B21D3B